MLDILRFFFILRTATITTIVYETQLNKKTKGHSKSLGDPDLLFFGDNL